jgi:small conductance mechanosensitive channel
MEEFLKKCVDMGATVGGKIVFAIVVLVVGSLIIKLIRKSLTKADRFTKLDKTVQSFLRSLINVVLYVVLIVSVIAILGIPMASITAVIASCGLAVGLALQGALSNLAGGLMILIFKPFRVGDYINASGAEGSVREISIFYTTLLTVDNKRVTVPNGDLMNANVTNFSCEDLRRVDLEFKITNDCDCNLAKGALLKAAEETTGVQTEPAPFARIVTVDDDTWIFTVRAWCKSGIYWDVYFDLIENCTLALQANGIDDPEERIAVRIVKDAD